MLTEERRENLKKNRDLMELQRKQQLKADMTTVSSLIRSTRACDALTIFMNTTFCWCSKRESPIRAGGRVLFGGTMIESKKKLVYEVGETDGPDNSVYYKRIQKRNINT